jgi:hypothetical protein
MKTLLTLILGLALFNTAPLLAQSAEQAVQKAVDSTTTNEVKPAIDDDC